MKSRSLSSEIERMEQADRNYALAASRPPTQIDTNAGPAHRALMERKLADPDWHAQVEAASERARQARRASLLRKRQTLLGRDGDNCYLCGSQLDDTMHIEHVAPRAHGGTDDDWNLALACSDCNNHKADNIVAFLITDRTPCYRRCR